MRKWKKILYKQMKNDIINDIISAKKHSKARLNMGYCIEQIIL